MSRGHDRERLVRLLLEAGGGPRPGPWWCARAAGSLGDADIVAARPQPWSGSLPSDGRSADLLLVEVKSTAAGPYEHFGPADRAELRAAAALAGAQAWLCWIPKARPGVAGVHGCWLPAREWPA